MVDIGLALAVFAVIPAKQTSRTEKEVAGTLTYQGPRAWQLLENQ